MSFGYDTRGDYWFTVDDRGNVSGYAVVVYQPVADVSGINTKINKVQALGTSLTGLAGPIGGLLGNLAITESLHGVEVDWSEPLPTRQGPITGTAGPNGITLEWATEQTNPLQMTVSLRYTEKIEHVAEQQAFPVDSPWQGRASMVDGPGQMVVSTGNAPSTSDDVKIAKAWSWSAHRTG
ncbi:hypothetical protein MRU69_15560 [Kocuria flava]|uniref:hypothetical protein n=1 Tax=Kocuria flava TaxID=446860 RepID=UPI001FF3C1A4|nr:hypothetical protein [Kocuria flava]MCJ8506255.1 hypothetical protein [Kocuria flava]